MTASRACIEVRLFHNRRYRDRATTTMMHIGAHLGSAATTQWAGNSAHCASPSEIRPSPATASPDNPEKNQQDDSADGGRSNGADKPSADTNTQLRQ